MYLRVLSTLALCGFVDACSTAPTALRDEWNAYGRTGHGDRYSPLTQISAANVAQLRVAWTHRTGEDLTGSFAERAAFEATPLYVDGTLFLSTPSGRVLALDPASGARRWEFDPKIDRAARYSEATSRGVATWMQRGAAGSCRRRIYIATLDARLIALDAADGELCSEFGTAGTVDLTSGIGEIRRGEYQVTSPPAVIGDLLIVGSAIGDNGAVQLERGVVRAFDARSGALRWSWDPIPATPDGTNWSEGFSSGAANAWAPISVDQERGLVIVPTSSPSPDYYGGLRKGNNPHANSVVALEAATGKVVWAFQVVHHDLWDYDVASQPILFDYASPGRSVPAVAVGTKMGHVFILDRRDGSPIFSVEERAVPQSDVPGEQTAATQPFPTFPPPLVPQRLTAEDAWGLTAADRQACADRIAKLRSEGIFTPPSLQGSVGVPGNVGGMHWGGMTLDPTRQILVANTNRLPIQVQLVPQEQLAAAVKTNRGNRIAGEFGRQRGAPYAMHRVPLLGDNMVPCNAPPSGALTAIDLRNQKVMWEVPLGFIPQMAEVPGYEMFGSINLGGAITANELVFIAATFDPHIRAFSLRDGRELWRGRLPVPAQSTPMTFEHEGKQYVVISAGGHAKLGTPLGDHVVAFSVP